jgi:hypothetical protein
VIEQLAFDLDDRLGPEAEAIVADFLARFSATERTDGALRARPCRCESPLILPDVLAFETRCAKCGRG